MSTQGLLFTLLACVSVVSGVYAAPGGAANNITYLGDQTTESCHTDSVSLASLQASAGSAELLVAAPYYSSRCRVYEGNDDAGGLSSPDINIGLKGDGLLNGEVAPFTGLEFIDEDDLQDLGFINQWGEATLSRTGVFDDPGWIHLAHYDGDSKNVSYSDVNLPGFSGFGDTGSNSIDQLLDFSLECDRFEDQDPDKQCTGGKWTLATELNIVELVTPLLGAATFDHLAISLKAAGEFIIYDFDFEDIFINEFVNNPSSALDFTTAYTLSGFLDTGDLSDKGISHLNVWARDPEDSSATIPEPLSVLLLGLACLLLLLMKTQIPKRN